MSLTEDYAVRLQREQQRWWKRLFDVQAPYRWNLRRLKPGRTLDVGCGVGRNLRHLDGDGVGVDPNEACVRAARAVGLAAFTPEDLDAAEGSFDSLLFAHVLEHMTPDEALGLVRRYLPYLKAGGRVIVFTPQESGYRSDDTHVTFLDFEGLESLAGAAGLAVERSYSFPFPRWMGGLFRYNEFVTVARK